VSKTCTVSVNGENFTARAGELLLDAALVNGVDMPFDCRSGYCGTCLVHLTNGLVAGGANAEQGMIHACQAYIVSDISVNTDENLLEPAALGRVAQINRLCSNVFEVVINLGGSPTYRAGQYYNVQFEGFPARAYSPTPSLGNAEPDGANQLRFHVKHIPEGAVSSNLNTRIRPGHIVSLFGPFGSACFVPGQSERLVLISGGTGFAPIWSIFDAALSEQPNREILLIAGTQLLSKLYMADALQLASQCSNVKVMAVTSEQVAERGWLRSGNLFNLLPELRVTDTIHAAGPPSLIEGLKKISGGVGCILHADPFVATGLPYREPAKKMAPPVFDRGKNQPTQTPFPVWRRAAE
jgi:NAD(P)H-flavin reductase/ferredoxin